MSILTRTKAMAEDTRDQAGNFADHAADSANQAIRSTQNVANAAFDRLTDKVEGARDQASPAIDRWSEQAEMALRRSRDAVREASALLRDRAAQVSDMTASRVRDEPFKSLLIAAAVGAAVVGLVNLFSRSRDRSVR